jgi:DNA-binding CsgD family transcriptional regulator
VRIVLRGCDRSSRYIESGVVVAVRASASPLLFVLKTSTLYGGSAWTLWRIRRLDDPLDRHGLSGFVMLFVAGCLAFDLAVRNVTAVVGVHTPDVAIALVQVTMNVPALLWLRRYLRQRALARPAQPPPPDLREQLGRLGLSSREADVVALIVAGLSHKDIAVRLTIAPDTVKKHAYHAYRKLGVENRVQLTYLVQHHTTV